LLVSSALTVYIIIRHFRSLLKLYLSVLIYLYSQLQLLAVIISFFVEEIARPIETRDVSRCEIKQGLQTFALLLPGYSILMISVVRTLFVAFPLSYFTFIKKRFQLAGLLVSVIICALVSAAPGLGLCKVIVNELYVSGSLREGVITVCGFEEKSKLNCKIFGVLLSFGFLLPILAVVFLYIYILHLVIKARKTHRILTKSSSSVQSVTKENMEQRSIPWSIIAILGVCVTTTLPWAGMITYTVEITEMLAEGGNLSRIFDVFYSVLQIVIGCSPLVYLVTTESMRRKLVGLICCWYNF
jgi:hypothetical protein